MFTNAPRFDVLRAARAIRALLADPDDLPQVFTILEALSGDTPVRLERRMLATETGKRLLVGKPDIAALLKDRAALRQLPEGSLGRAYLAFVESEGISAEGIVEADVSGRTRELDFTPEQIFVHLRMRDTHDLWHAVTGYKGDVLGEAALLGFTLAQTWNFGVAVIVGAGLFKTAGNRDARSLIVDGFRRGLRAGWLPAEPWEEMLALPVAEVQAKLGVGKAPVYTPVRTADLRAQAAAAA
ncbi:MAG TPA: Coq4 family protein [Byssovorax sp.]|jgi:ubiquinone biosynthesis protein COQ4